MTTSTLKNEHLQQLPHTVSVTGIADLYPQPELAKNVSPKSPFEAQHENLLTSNGRVLFATDEWFASADNLLKASDPFFDPEAYCEQGKVMDGWESRRRREEGHDWCLIQFRGNVKAVEIDTAHFTGNQVPRISLEICSLNCEQETQLTSQLPGAIHRLLHGGIQGTGMTPAQVAQAEKACREFKWESMLPESPLQPGYEATRMHYFTLPEAKSGTLIRVNYFPDGGVARLRLWGEPLKNPPRVIPGPAYSPIVTGRTCSVIPHSATSSALPSEETLVEDVVEFSSQNHGGSGFYCTNKHYGDVCNLIQPNLGRDMGDGWETARHPNRPRSLETDPATGLVKSDLLDYSIIKLGKTTLVDRVILDTKHFRGNYPESVLVEGCSVKDDDTVLESASEASNVDWFTLVPRGRMAPDSEHLYSKDRGQLRNTDIPITHVKISIFPDGGLSRVRIYGKAAN